MSRVFQAEQVPTGRDSGKEWTATPPIAMSGLPTCTIISNPRARRASLRMCLHRGLVVVLPPGFDRSQLSSLLAGKRDWIARTSARIETRRAQMAPHLLEKRPTRLELISTGQDWEVAYRPVATAVIRVREEGQNCLVLAGPIEREDLVGSALKRWALQRARRTLGPWLDRLSASHGLSFARLTIRAQRSRWGSCSGRRTISLNGKLLFLPPDLVEYVLLHELCHTRHLDHTPSFWSLLQHLDPDFRAKDQGLRHSWRYVPAWLS